MVILLKYRNGVSCWWGYELGEMGEESLAADCDVEGLMKWGILQWDRDEE